MGATATPERTDGRGLNKFFTDMVMAPSVRELILGGYLCNFVYYPGQEAVDIEDTSSQSAMDQEASKKVLVGDIHKEFQDRVSPGEQVLLFGPTVEQSKEYAHKFESLGVNAVHLDAKTPENERRACVERFKNGEITVLSNINLFSEGFNSPDCRWLFMAKPTSSIIQFRQMCGRVLRKKKDPKIKAGIVDFVKNYKRCGLPDDDIAWSLDSRVKKDKKERKYKECKSCGGMNYIHQKNCKYCGTPFPVYGNRSSLESVHGKFGTIESFYDKLIASHDRGRVNFYQFCELNNVKKPDLKAFFDEISALKNNG